MIDFIWDILNSERNWSWAVIGIVYIFAAFLIRGLFLNPLKMQLDNLNRNNYSEVKKNYFRSSLGGWILFFLPMLALIIFWIHPEWLIALPKRATLAITVLTVLFASIILHIRAFGIAASKVLKTREYQDVNASKSYRTQ